MVMENVELGALTTSPVKPFFRKRSVDDVISVVSGNEAERLLSHLNSLEPSIQFTLGREKDRYLLFLEIDDEREPTAGFAAIPYIQGVTEPIKRILNSHNVKVAQKPFQT